MRGCILPGPPPLRPMSTGKGASSSTSTTLFLFPRSSSSTSVHSLLVHVCLCESTPRGGRAKSQPCCGQVRAGPWIRGIAPGALAKSCIGRPYGVGELHCNVHLAVEDKLERVAPQWHVELRHKIVILLAHLVKSAPTCEPPGRKRRVSAPTSSSLINGKKKKSGSQCLPSAEGISFCSCVQTRSCIKRWHVRVQPLRDGSKRSRTAPRAHDLDL